MRSPEQGAEALEALIARYQSGDLGGARAECERGLDLRPDDISLLYLYSLILQRQGESRMALSRIEQVLALQADDPLSLNHHGEVLLSLGESTAAISSFERALAAGPNNATSYNNLAVIHFQQGDVAVALDYLVRGIAVNPDDTDLIVNGAQILLQAGRATDAQTLLESFVHDNPLDIEARVVLAELKKSKAEDDQSVRSAADHSSVMTHSTPEPDRVQAEKISIILPLLGVGPHLGVGINAIMEEATSRDIEIIVVDGGISDDLRNALEAVNGQTAQIRFVKADSDIELHTAYSLGAAQATGDLLLFLSSSLQPVAGWLESLLIALKQTPQAGIIAAKILFAGPGGDRQLSRMRHCGVVFDQNRAAKHLYEYCLAELPFISRHRELQAVGSFCMLLRQELFTEVGGFDPAMGQYAGLDLCFKARSRQLSVVVCPTAELYEIGQEKMVGLNADATAYAGFLEKWQQDIVPDEYRCYAEDGLRLPAQGTARVAMATPVTPQKTGVAHYVQEILPYLAQHTRIDLFVDDYVPSDPEVLAQHMVYLLRDLEAVDARHAYEQKLFQIGNNRFHTAIYKAALCNPGVIVLHEYDCKGCSTERTNRELLTKLFGVSKGVIVHNEHSKKLLEPEFPTLPFGAVPHILADNVLREDIGQQAARRKLGLPESAFVVLSLGLIQPHKRNHIALEAFAKFSTEHPGALLVLAGEAPDPIYAQRLSAMAARLGIHSKVILTGWVSDAAFFDYLYAADVTVNLRYPARGEESGSLTRILGCGRPALVSDYAQFSELPDNCVVKIGFENEVDDVAAALGRLHDDEQLRASLSKHSSELIRSRNNGERVGRLYMEFCLHAAQDNNAGMYSPRQARLQWTGPVWGVRHPARELILALDRLGVGVQVRASEIPLRLRSPINEDAARRLAELSELPLMQHYIHVHSGSVRDYRRDPGAINSVMMVCDQPFDELAKLDVDGFWVPSAYVQKSLQKRGIAADRIHKIPYGVPSLLYATSVFENTRSSEYKLMLCPTNLSSDEGWKEVLLAFLQEFGGRSDVRLMLKLNADTQDAAEIEQTCVEALREFHRQYPKIPIEHYTHVQYDRQYLADDDLPAYYWNADVIIAPACQAAFGRTLLEALALGVPVMTTDAAGQAEFITTRNATIIPGSGRKSLPDVMKLRKCMRDFVKNDQKQASAAMAGRSDILQNWTWINSARCVAALLSAQPKLTESASDPAQSANVHQDRNNLVSPPESVTEVVMKDPASNRFGFNVIGYVSGNLGIGVTARNVVQMLLDRGFPVSILDLDPGLGRKGQDNRFAEYMVESAEAMPYTVNLLILPPAELSSLLAANPAFFRTKSRLNVGFSMWELSILPIAWRQALESLDVLVAESEFIRYAFQFSLSHVLTLCTEHPVYMPATVCPNRKRFGLPEDGVLFIMSFEPFSDPARKNPFAVIDAFKASLADNLNGHLVIKLNNANCKGATHPVLEKLRAYTAGMARIHVIDTTLDYDEVLSLYASCDVYVSLHRAEGLGLGMLEAMLLGKPVIATAWSGNMSFMDHTNACPVAYRLVPVEGSIPAYSREVLGADAYWAEADQVQAAEWMRRLCDSAELRQSIGERAATDAAQYHARACAGRFVDEIQAIWYQRTESSSAGGAQVDTKIQLAPITPSQQVKATENRDAHPAQTSYPTDPKSAATLDPYQLWQEMHALTDADRQILLERAATRHEQPHFHILMLIRQGEESLLANTVDSLGAQLAADWSLSIIADYPAPDPAFEAIEQLRWIEVTDGQNQTERANKLIREVPSEWLMIMHPGDQLAEQALTTCADYIALFPAWRFIYTDEDHIDAYGLRSDPEFKPDFNLDLLRSMSYIGRACLMDRDAVLEVGGCGNLTGLAAYDLAFRILDAYGEKSLGHIDELLYHGSVDASDSLSGLAEDGEQIAALQHHLDRNHLRAKIQRGVIQGTFMVDYQWEQQPFVSVIIPTRDRADLLSACVGSILSKTGYPNYEIIIVDNDSREEKTHAYFTQIQEHDNRVRVIQHPGEFNFSEINNSAVKTAGGEYLLLLNNDTMILQANWLERMLSLGIRPEVGIVGVRLIQPDQRVQHAGIVLGMGPHGIAEHVNIGKKMQDAGYLGRLQVVQNLSAITAACMLIRKDIYLQVGGMDGNSLKVLFNDVDLCLKVRDNGYKIVWTPFVTLLHHGSISVKQMTSPAENARALKELHTMESRWLSQLARDPNYNRHLNLTDRTATLAEGIDARWSTAFRDRHRVIGFGVGSFGSWQYRVVQPCAAMDAAAVAQTTLMPFENHRIRIPTVAELERLAPDVLLMHNTLHDLQIKMMADYKRVNKPFIVFGEDDLMFALPQKNPFRKVVFKDMKKRIRQCLELSDRLVVTTEPLAEAFKGMIDDVRIVPNYLDDRIWGHLKSKRQQGKKPRVGWAGAMQHGGDLEILEQVVRETADEVDWVFFGMCPESIKPFVKEIFDPVTFDLYPAKLATLNLDLAVAPLEHNRFNESKSNLRILEYGALGWPVICSNIYPYQNGPVTLVPNNARAWIKAIRERAHDLDAAAHEGDALKAWVKEHWMLEDHLHEWLDALTETSSGTKQSIAAKGRG